MTRALFLAHTAAPSGAEIALHRLVRAMDKTEVTVVFTETGPMVDKLRADGIDTVVVDGAFDSRSVTIEGMSVRRMIGGVTGLLRLGWAVGAVVRESGADVVVAESSKALLMGTIAARRAGVPLVWHSHDRISREYFGTLFTSVLHVLGWTACRGFIANSTSTLASLPTWRRPAVVAYPGVDGSADRPVGARPEQSAPADTVLCLVARLTPWKGHVLFLEAVAAMTTRPAHVFLVGGTFFGEEPYRAELEAMAAELELPVTFTGHVDDPRDYMRMSDVLVHCTLTAEPFGQVVVEGMLAGCAVVASRPGGPAEIVEHGVNGMLVDSGDRAGLTAMLDRVVADRDLRTRLSAAAPARAAHFDIEESARTVESFLEDVLDTVSVRHGR
ncbi:glycosyltransferase family 4 protein [Rhodococcus sp. BP-316]|uniref:glycosyltransferase family 4 protein n=1 Tax=Rhodococcus sp. BP-316 TaxID=2739445 RepID=UPI001C9B5B0E|nr:glycosyltransferase family 4 protein [Rhodococcus sp. BP-316]MBY6683209.1 glycosyltransferase family 4 protein [Rhodococcus sp. BP-316]